MDADLQPLLSIVIFLKIVHANLFRAQNSIFKRKKKKKSPEAASCILMVSKLTRRESSENLTALKTLSRRSR